MKCPRCQRESGVGTVFCPGCGAPLTLATESEIPLDASLDLDRRGGAAAPTLVRPQQPATVRLPSPRPQPATAHRPGAVRAPAAPSSRPAAAPAAPAPRPAAARAAAPPDPDAAARPSPAQAAPPRPPPVPPAARTVLEPVVPPVGDLSHWDMRLSQMPRERSPDFDRASTPLPPVPPVPDDRPEPRMERPASRPPRAEPRPALLDELAVPESLEIELGPREVHLRRASDGRRVTAWVLDGLPFLALFALVLRFALDQLPHEPLDILGYLDLAGVEARDITLPVFACVLVLYAVYHALSHGLAGATLGKRLVGLRVVRRDGRRPGLGRAAIRALLSVLSVAMLGLGVLLALFTRSGRAMHDFLARTWVVQAP